MSDLLAGLAVPDLDLPVGADGGQEVLARLADGEHCVHAGLPLPDDAEVPQVAGVPDADGPVVGARGEPLAVLAQVAELPDRAEVLRELQALPLLADVLAPAFVPQVHAVAPGRVYVPDADAGVVRAGGEDVAAEVQEAPDGAEALPLHVVVVRPDPAHLVDPVQQGPRAQAEDPDDPVEAAGGRALARQRADRLDGHGGDPYRHQKLAVLLRAALPDTDGHVVRATHKLVPAVGLHAVHAVHVAVEGLQQLEVVVDVKGMDEVVHGCSDNEVGLAEVVLGQARVKLDRVLGAGLVASPLLLRRVGPVARAAASGEVPPLLLHLLPRPHLAGDQDVLLVLLPLRGVDRSRPAFEHRGPPAEQPAGKKCPAVAAPPARGEGGAPRPALPAGPCRA
mmetsp:Transcript_116746/g.355204  ORF Transcript_116746/g.355204 Transcript_116746/m.355204 type:complete len:394 (-) Transcript_116746:14-1195(-)